jgi:hypothetical protein
VPCSVQKDFVEHTSVSSPQIRQPWRAEKIFFSPLLSIELRANFHFTLTPEAKEFPQLLRSLLPTIMTRLAGSLIKQTTGKTT